MKKVFAKIGASDRRDNRCELLAGAFWRKYNMYEPARERAMNVALLGYGDVGREIFKSGYLNNIFKRDQQITYHIFGGDPADQSFLCHLSEESSAVTGNRDRIIAHPDSYAVHMDELKGMDRIIIADGDVASILQELLFLTKGPDIFLFGGDERDLSQLLTEDKVRNEPLLRDAKLINKDYSLRYGNGDEKTLPEEADIEKEWAALDDFAKGSNLARADYYWIEYRNKENGMDTEERKELEHIRWCRYHLYHGWTYSAGKKDPVKRTHPYLVPYSELPEHEQMKDGIFNEAIRNELDAHAREKIYAIMAPHL